MIVIGYLRVSTSEQADSGLGLAAQRATIAAEAERRGWSVTWIADDGYTASNINRPGIARALTALAAHEADALVVAKVDRLARSMVDFVGLMLRAEREKWRIVALDLGVDMTTPAGEFMAHMVAAAAQYERRLISARTKDALAAAKARGTRLGRPRAVPAAALARVVADRAAGLSVRAIAQRLNDEGVPTVRGGRCWHAGTVRGLLDSAALDAGLETVESTERSA